MTSSPQIPSLVIQRIEQLKDENAALKAERDALLATQADLWNIVEQYETKSTPDLRAVVSCLLSGMDRMCKQLDAENARLREALEPFARVADAPWPTPPEWSDDTKLFGAGEHTVTLGDCRRAREVSK